MTSDEMLALMRLAGYETVIATSVNGCHIKASVRTREGDAVPVQGMIEIGMTINEAVSKLFTRLFLAAANHYRPIHGKDYAPIFVEMPL